MPETNRIMPMVALRGLVIFPYMVLNFEVGRKRSIAALEQAMTKDQEIFLSAQKDLRVETPDGGDIYPIGVVAKIRQILKVPGDALRVLVEGLYRAEIVQYLAQDEEGIQVEVRECERDLPEDDLNAQAYMRTLTARFEQYAAMSNTVLPEAVLSIGEIQSPAKFADMVAANVLHKLEDKQEIIETLDVLARLEKLIRIVTSEIEILKIEKDINSRVKRQMDKMQQEHYMREQIRAIQTKLGDDDGDMEEIEGYKKRVDELPLTDASKKKILKEIARLSRMQPTTPDYNVALTYIEWIMSLPFDTYTEDDMDLIHARAVLDEDHFGLQKVKERILEYLAVRKLKADMRGPILCFAGPPGVGKTSIARSIARALGRKFVRMSLGGVRDEAEIRGHRRTYIGAVPGRIVTSIKQAGTMNPVFLLDEIDKMSSDVRGDPASAMLEVLDPEINATFMDHYLDIEFDLSKVMFVTTANDVSNIPRPLYDRMEIIELSSYTEYEKLNIARKHLIPKQIQENGLSEKMICIEEDAIRKMITEYTAESGVRSLERKIADVLRKGAREIMERFEMTDELRESFPESERITITAENLEKYLGIPRFGETGLPSEDSIGVAIGLAWTAAGGQTMPVEASVMEGSGHLQLTGQLGDVMKESAQTGYSLVRAMAKELGIESEFYKDKDIHVHVPEGAVPKDGPSAGITIALAITSALLERKIRADVAMTGEITLTGRVLPIGGLKEKALAAHRNGIRRIIVPAENRKDTAEIPEEIAKQLEFIYVKNFKEVLKTALKPKRGARKK